MQVLGDEGYMRRTVETLEMMDNVVAGISQIPHLHVLAPPVVPHISYASDTLDIFAVAQGMTDRGWAMHQDEFPRPLIRGLWPWGMRPHVAQYLEDLAAVTNLVADGALTTRAQAAY
jgi:hypothetical protein